MTGRNRSHRRREASGAGFGPGVVELELADERIDLWHDLFLPRHVRPSMGRLAAASPRGLAILLMPLQ